MDLELVQNWFHDSPSQSSTSPVLPHLALTYRSALGESGSSATAWGLEAEVSAAAIGTCGKVFLGRVSQTVARMEACIDPGPTRNRRSLASRRLQGVLGLDFEAQGACWKGIGQQRIAPTHFPYGCRQRDVGCATHSWGVEDAWFRYFRAKRITLDAEGASESRSVKTMVDIFEYPS